jgi:uncharacterized protein (TIGR03435 family)
MPRQFVPPRIALILLVIASEARAQTPLPTFEAATVRRSATAASESHRQDVQLQPGRLLLGNVRLITCLQIAYNISPNQISGPDWLKTESVDIVGKAPEAVGEDQIRLMLHGLLAERFKLKLHRETREVASYILTVGKNGPKMQESTKEGPGKLQGTKNVLRVEGATMDEFVGVLTQPLQSPVVNQTGLTKRYDFVLDMSPYVPTDRQPGDPPPDMAAIMITALNEKLGLKLESKKTPIEILVIDRMEKIPTEN